MLLAVCDRSHAIQFQWFSLIDQTAIEWIIPRISLLTVLSSLYSTPASEALVSAAPSPRFPSDFPVLRCAAHSLAQQQASRRNNNTSVSYHIIQHTNLAVTPCRREHPNFTMNPTNNPTRLEGLIAVPLHSPVISPYTLQYPIIENITPGLTGWLRVCGVAPPREPTAESHCLLTKRRVPFQKPSSAAQ